MEVHIPDDQRGETNLRPLLLPFALFLLATGCASNKSLPSARQNTTSPADIPRWKVYFRTDGKRPLDSPAPRVSPAKPDQKQGSVVSTTWLQTNGDSNASDGWLPDGVFTTSGNNVVAYVDLNNDSEVDVGEQPTATSVDIGGRMVRTFDGTYDHSASPMSKPNRDAAVIDAFVTANWFHDRMYTLGFTEKEGNFQGSLRRKRHDETEGDPVHLRLTGKANVVQNYPHSDGKCCPEVELGIFDGPNPDRRSSLDHTALLHELAHLVVSRLASGRRGIKGLRGSEREKGLIEGYTDAMALMLLTDPSDRGDGRYPIGAYAAYKLNPNYKDFKGIPPDWKDNYYFGLRHFPYSTDFCVNPLTFDDAFKKDFTVPGSVKCAETAPVRPGLSGMPVDRYIIGEVWASTLWQVRSYFVVMDPNDGNDTFLRFLLRSIKRLEGASSPTLLTARDTLLRVVKDANLILYDSCLVWAGVSKRGLGFNASIQAGVPMEDYTVPKECTWIN